MSTLTSPHKTLILNAWQNQGERNDDGLATAAVCNALRTIDLEARSMAGIMNKPRRRGLFMMVYLPFLRLGQS